MFLYFKEEAIFKTNGCIIINMQFNNIGDYKFIIKKARFASGVLPVCLNTGRILLGQRGPKLDTEPNKWANFGGKPNPYETPYENAVREFYEESGKIMALKLIPSFVDSGKDNFKYYNFIGIVVEEFAPIIGKLTVDFEVEVANYKWLTLEQFYSFPTEKLHWGLVKFRKEAKTQLFELLKQ